VSIKPDQAQIQFAVLTTATTAQAAANQNATQVTAVLTPLGAVLGPNPDIKTLSYSLNPNYTHPQNGQPILTGHTAPTQSKLPSWIFRLLESHRHSYPGWRGSSAEFIVRCPGRSTGPPAGAEDGNGSG
jgi:hypothetical protein